MDEFITIRVFSNYGTPEQVKEFQGILREHNVNAEFLSKDKEDCVWLLSGTRLNLKRVLWEYFNVWRGVCPILPEELMCDEDIELLGSWNDLEEACGRD